MRGLLVVVAMALPAVARAQTPAPWGSSASPSPEPEPPEESSSPPPAPAPNTVNTREHYGTTPDPAFSYNFQMPTARPIHEGDVMASLASDLGWVGVRYGFTRRFDAGIGVPFYVAGLSADARYALYLGDGAAVSLFAYATVPFLPSDGAASSWLGFTWHGGGPAWVAGPLVSVWGSRAAIHLGAFAAQRVLLGGAWTIVHLTIEGRISDGVAAIAQGVLAMEVVNESGNVNTHPLIGNAQPRVFPYAIAGLRLHSRKFAVDFGVLAVLSSDAPLGSGSVVWPWTSVSQTF
jgi:hypothetical protein